MWIVINTDTKFTLGHSQVIFLWGSPRIFMKIEDQGSYHRSKDLDTNIDWIKIEDAQGRGVRLIPKCVGLLTLKTKD